MPLRDWQNGLALAGIIVAIGLGIIASGGISPKDYNFWLLLAITIVVATAVIIVLRPVRLPHKDQLEIQLLPDSHKSYVDVPCVDVNDYPKDGRSTRAHLRLQFRLRAAREERVDKVDCYLIVRNPLEIYNFYDVNNAALSHSGGPALGEAIERFVDKYSGWDGVVLPAGIGFPTVVAKYADFPGTRFHKSSTPFEVVTVFHFGTWFVSVLSSIPLAGTGSASISTCTRMSRDTGMDAIKSFATDGGHTARQWGTFAVAEPQSRAV